MNKNTGLNDHTGVDFWMNLAVIFVENCLLLANSEKSINTDLDKTIQDDFLLEDGNEDECTRERVRDQIKGGLKDVLGLGDESIRGQVKDAAKSVLGGVGSSFVNSYLEPWISK